MIRATLATMLVAVLAACTPAPEPPSDEEVRANNRGVALMGQYRNEEARQIFAALSDAHPDWHAVRVNEIIATLNRQREGDEYRALEMAGEVLAVDPTNLRAAYIAGLMHLYTGEPSSALARFRGVADSAPGEAHVAYFTGQALDQLGRHDEALAAYRRAIEADPYLRSAYYGAALALRQLGRADEARAMLDDYQRFAGNPRAHLAEFRYTRMGPLAEAWAVGRGAAASAAAIPDGPLFGEPEVLDRWQAAVPHGAVLVAADFHEGQGPDLLLAAPGATRAWRAAEEGFLPLPDHALAGLGGVQAASWGVPNVGTAFSAFLCRDGENRILERGEQGWAPGPGAEDLADAGRCADSLVFDADHDGDLDWWVANRDGPDELYSNNGDGSWRRLSTAASPALAGDARPTRQLLATDLDGDRDADLVALHDAPPHRVLVNDRLWQYRDAPGAEGFAASEAVAVTVADFDASGRNELVALETGGTLAAWRVSGDGAWTRRELGPAGVADPARAWLDARDFDGDGRPELLLAHPAGFRVLAPSEAGGLVVRHESEADLAALAAVLEEPAVGPTLVGVVRESGGTVLKHWPAGAGRGRFVAVSPGGRSDDADGVRSNLSGIGTGMTLRAGDRWALADSFDATSAAGQSLQPVAIGVGTLERADFIRLAWTDGVLQTEMDLAAGEVHEIAETQRQLSSCPVVFAHDGRDYRFVSDVLGVAGIGFMIEPGRYAEPRPWEFFRFPDGALAPHEQAYRIRIGEPMQEVAYLDAARLHVYDLPPGWDLVVDERMHAGGGPAPTGAVIAFRETTRRVPLRAFNDRGEDVTSTLSEADFEAAPPGATDARFLGRLAAEHVLTMEFGTVVNPHGSRPVLVADGWVEYPYSQTVFAAWQAGAGYEAPTLEAYSGGRWQVVHERFGYPAGMPRRMALPLAALPEGTTALRLRSNLEIYWDSVAVVDAAGGEQAGLVHRALAPHSSRLEKTGFPRRDTLAQKRPFYDHADRSPFWDTEYPRGRYTALGPVDRLVSAADDAIATIGPGDELALAFPLVPNSGAGRRVFVLEVRGWAKDMDLYTRDGGTVGPLPTAGRGDAGVRDRLHRETMTRWQGGF